MYTGFVCDSLLECILYLNIVYNNIKLQNNTVIVEHIKHHFFRVMFIKLGGPINKAKPKAQFEQTHFTVVFV